MSIQDQVARTGISTKKTQGKVKKKIVGQEIDSPITPAQATKSTVGSSQRVVLKNISIKDIIQLRILLYI